MGHDEMGLAGAYRKGMWKIQTEYDGMSFHKSEQGRARRNGKRMTYNKVLTIKIRRA